MKTRRFALAAALALSTLAGAALAQAPVAATTPPPLPEGVPAFEVAQYNSFTWYGRFGYTNAAFIDTGDGILVVDTGWTKEDGENLKAQIEEKTKGKPVRWIVMTQTDIDSNGGISAFLPTDATVFVHARAADPLARGVLASAPGRKSPIIVGVSDRAVLAAGGRRFEIVAAPAPAHSEYDLAVLCNDNGLLFVGDLVTPGRCPTLTGPAADPKSWVEMIDRVGKLNPAGLVPTRGEPTKVVQQELERTRAYLERVLKFLEAQKAKKAPEARVAAELSLAKLGDYCPPQVDNANVLALYRRMRDDGTFAPTAPTAPPAPAVPAPPPAAPR